LLIFVILFLPVGALPPLDLYKNNQFAYSPGDFLSGDKKSPKNAYFICLIPPAFRQRAPRYRLRPARKSSAALLEDATSYQVKGKKE
jgi:hypothetical protein